VKLRSKARLRLRDAPAHAATQNVQKTQYMKEEKWRE
jgi:hypothetical protein